MCYRCVLAKKDSFEFRKSPKNKFIYLSQSPKCVITYMTQWDKIESKMLVSFDVDYFMSKCFE